MSPEIEVLLKTKYDGTGSQKVINDLDKISASGAKVQAVFEKIPKSLRDFYKNALPQHKPDILAQYPGLAWPEPPTGTKGEGSGAPPIIPPPVIPKSPSPSVGSGGNGGIAGSFFSKLLSNAIRIPAGLLVYRAINAPLQALTKTIKGLNDAIESARKLYARALSSGLGLQFTAKRSLLANTIGVSEKDVFQFGAAIKFISPRLQSASDILAKTTPNLTSVSYGFKILEADLQALFALVVSDLSPAIRKTTLFLSELIHVFEKFHTLISGAFKVTLNALIDSLPVTLQAILNPIKDAIASLPDPGEAPNPVAYMQQIHASSLEHMGLIIGGIGGQTDFAAQTAQNTKKTADAVQKIAQKMTSGRGGASFYDPFASMP